jgi:hypothetical protein
MMAMTRRAACDGEPRGGETRARLALGGWVAAAHFVLAAGGCQRTDSPGTVAVSAETVSGGERDAAAPTASADAAPAPKPEAAPETSASTTPPVDATGKSAGPPPSPADPDTGGHPSGHQGGGAADPCLSGETSARLASTEAIFRGLGALMDSYLADAIGDEPTRCLTAAAAANDPVAAKIEDGLVKAWQQKRTEVLRGLRSEYVWLRVWMEEFAKPVAGIPFAHEPALTRLVREKGGQLAPEAELHCRVAQAKATGDKGVIDCEAGGAAFTVEVPKAAVSVGGALARLNRGDVIRFSQHPAIIGTTSSGRRTGWLVPEVPLEGLAVAETSRCCETTAH